jgi:hypothetical protein
MKEKNRENHPALNIDKGKIMAKATAFALCIVLVTLGVVFLILKLK